jgi:hypothetical protein
MVKFVSTFRLKPGFDRDESFQLWHEVHTRRIKQMLKDYGLKRYIISKVLPASAAEPDFFGLVQLWFDGLENARKGMEYVYSQPTDAFSERITDTRRVFVVEEKEIDIKS